MVELCLPIGQATSFRVTLTLSPTYCETAENSICQCLTGSHGGQSRAVRHGWPGNSEFNFTSRHVRPRSFDRAASVMVTGALV